jgi:RNA polymerase sigma-70 factor (ECF subfamily)
MLRRVCRAPLPPDIHSTSSHVFRFFLSIAGLPAGAHVSSFSTARFLTVPLARQLAREGGLATAGGVPADEELLAALQTGDSEALGLLFRRYERVVRCIGARIIGDDSEAEDLVQDLFLFLQRKCGIFDSSKCSARSWIIQMAYHRAIGRRRYLMARRFYGQRAIAEHADVLVGTPTAESDYSAEAVFGRNGLEQVMKSLSEDQRETLRLYFFEGYTLAEIAQKLGQSHGNVRNHYYRGLNRLRRQMFANKTLAGRRNDK